MQKGDVVGGGSEGTFSWEVTFVDGVGQNGIGEGKFNWQITVHGPGRELLSITWMTGVDKEVAIRLAKFQFKEHSGAPIPV